MTELQARIDRVMELDKHRTPGEWYRDVAHAIRSYVNPTLHQVSDQVWPFVNLKESDFQFILNAPEMVSIIKELQAALNAYSSNMTEYYNGYAQAQADGAGQPLTDEEIRIGVNMQKNKIIELTEELERVRKHRDFEIAELHKNNLMVIDKLNETKAQLSAKDALIAELQKENEWLPIETMPESEPVLVVFGIRPDVKIGILSTDGDIWDESFACTLSDPKVWKKLPKPPKGI